MISWSGINVDRIAAGPYASTKKEGALLERTRGLPFTKLLS